METKKLMLSATKIIVEVISYISSLGRPSGLSRGEPHSLL